jgi:hypothetical protein
MEMSPAFAFGSSVEFPPAKAPAPVTKNRFVERAIGAPAVDLVESGWFAGPMPGRV